MIDQVLMEKVMEEVVRALKQKGVCNNDPPEGAERILVIGECGDLPSDYCEYVPTGIEDYEQHRNIRRYSKIFISRLTLAELSDIAQGRDGCPVSCAVVNALLRGMEVILSDKALWHRKLANQGSPALYALIENNVRQLQKYGVKILAGEHPVVPQRTIVPALGTNLAKDITRPKGRMLISESVADEMVKGASGKVCIPANAIITPAAMDVFIEHKIEIVKES